MIRLRELYLIHIFCGLNFLIILSGCTTDNFPINPKYSIQEQYEFIQNGEVSREEIVMRLGNPSNVLEKGRILTFQLVQHEDGNWYPHVASWFTDKNIRKWQGRTCSLVLIFGENGILERHNIIDVHGLQ